MLVSEIDQFYKSNDDILSNNGKRPHPRSCLPEIKKWNENVENFFERNPRHRPKDPNN